MPTKIRVLSAADVERVATPALMIDSQRAAFEALARGEALQPERILIDGPGENATFCYAARAGADVCKFGAVVPSNAGRGLPTISALIVVLDRETGVPAALLDGTAVTTARTAAASAVAADALAAPDTSGAAIIGSGVQAAAHIDALAELARIERVTLVCRDVSRGEEIARDAGARHGRLTIDVVGAAELGRVVADSPLTICATTATSPLFAGSVPPDGATVISIGSFAAGRCEVDGALIERARAVVVDDVAVSLEHAGPVIEAVAAGTLTEDQIVPLGEVLTGARDGRTGPGDVVLYNSVGIGVQDAAAAAAIIEAAGDAGETIEL